MAADEYLLERINNILTRRKVKWTGKRMFGGFCYMVDDKMCLGNYDGGLMVHVGPGEALAPAERTGAKQMIHGGRPMTGFLWIDPSGYDMDADLEFWVARCLAFNPLAKAPKKKG